MSFNNYPDQKSALKQTRIRHFSLLISSGILKKSIEKADESTSYSQFGECLPVILGSRHEDYLALFVGFEKIDQSGNGRTKLVHVGTVQESNDGNMVNDGFELDDLFTVKVLFKELEVLKTILMPDYDSEMGVIRSNG